MRNHKLAGRLAVVGVVSAAVVLMSLNAGGGSLDPTAPPGPTMRTLDDIYNAVAPPPQAGPIDYYLKIDSIPGEATDEGHKDWINLVSLNHHISKPVTRDASGGTQSGPSDHGDFQIIKRIDKSTPLLSLYCCNGQSIGDVVIELMKAGADGRKQKYIDYKLADVIVTGYGLVGPGGTNGGDVPAESISFNYSKIEWTYPEYDSTGNQTGAVQTQWDVLGNSGS